MKPSSQYFSVTRRVFLHGSVKGTAGLLLSGFAVLAPSGAPGAVRLPYPIAVPSPQFTSWAPGGRLLVTCIAKDGSYGLLRARSTGTPSDKILAVGSGPGQFNWPQGIAVHGSVAYIADSNNGRLQRFNLDTGVFLEPIGGLGKKTGLFLRPLGVCVFEDELFIADTRNHRIQVFSLNGIVKRSFGELGDADDQFRLPTSCAVSAERELFVIDSKHALVKVFSLDGRFLRKFGGLSSIRKEPGLLNMPTGISLDAVRQRVIVTDTGNGRVQVFDTRGKFLSFLEAPGGFLAPRGVSYTESGGTAVSDPDADRVWIFAA